MSHRDLHTVFLHAGIMPPAIYIFPVRADLTDFKHKHESIKPVYNEPLPVK